MLKVIQVATLLSVSDVTIYKKMKKLRNELKGKIVKENGVKLLTDEAIEIIKNDLCAKTKEGSEPSNNKHYREANELQNNFGEELVRKLEDALGNQVKKLEQQVDLIHSELKEKNKMLNINAETINQLIETHSKDRERTDTIIMKLTQDLERTRKQIEDKTTTETKNKEESPKTEVRKTDRVISMEQYINSKLTEEQERRNFERLQRQIEDPLQGKSLLYKFYIKMFRPDKLRGTG